MTSACPVPEFTTRHDEAVHYILRDILVSTRAPEHILSQLRFGKASLVSEHTWGERRVKIRAGVKVITDPELYHNRPDILVCLSNPTEVYVLEVAVSHLQNIRLQEEIKKVRYGKNSTVHVTHQNYKDVPRSYNIREAVGKIYKGPVKFGVQIFGSLGELLETEASKEFVRYLQQLGVRDTKILLYKCCTSICKATSKIIVKRLNV